MELGNAIFGNSRGRFSIERGTGWEEELFRLFNAYSPNRDNSWREYGVEFENSCFFVFPYYWGDCTCGYEHKERDWSESHKHTKDCYQTDYKKLDDIYGIGKKWQNREKTFIKELIKLYEKHKIEYDKEEPRMGCAIRCSCEHDKLWDKFVSENSHSNDCPIIRPNFKHKRTGFEIQWYKYPLRDSYKNQDISLEDFKTIVDECIYSLEN